MVKLMNEHARWVHPEKVKIGQCVKCKGFMSCGWLFPDMQWWREYCYGCHDFRKFKVTKHKYEEPKEIQDTKETKKTGKIKPYPVN